MAAVRQNNCFDSCAGPISASIALARGPGPGQKTTVMGNRPKKAIKRGGLAVALTATSGDHRVIKGPLFTIAPGCTGARRQINAALYAAYRGQE